MAKTQTERFEDLIQPFLIDKTHLHGRFVRLNSVVETILSRHAYPLRVSFLLAEQLVLTALLSRALKGEGIITLQTKGEGAIGLMVTDVTSKGELRGYAESKPEAKALLSESPRKTLPLQDIFGEGYMAITLDHGMGKQPYQGIVALTGTTLTDCCLSYLHQSEQFKVHIHTQVAKTQGAGWQAGGLLVQRLPEDEHSQQIILPSPMETSDPVPESKGEAWERTQIFVDSLTRDEMLDPQMPPRDLLYRLFHDEGVWVYESSVLSVGCRCTRERIAAVLDSLSAQERADLTVDGVMTVNCQFCNKAEVF